MATTFQIVDPDNLTTILFDLNDSTGANNAEWGSLKTHWGVGGTFQLGSPDLDASEFTPTQRDGGDIYHTRAPLVQSSWRQRCNAADYDSLYKGVGRLAQLLRQGGVIKYVPHGSSHTRYIDFEPSSAPALLAGRETELLNVIRQFDTPQGIDIQISRQPFLRGAELDPTVNVLKNSTMLVDQGGTAGWPDDWTIGAVTSYTIDADTNSWQFTISTGTATDVATQDTAAATAAAADVWTFSFWAESDSATAKVRAVIRYLDSGGSALGSESTGTLTTLTSYPQRISVTSSAAPASTDRVRVYIRVDNDDATARVIRVCNAQLEEASSASLFRVGSTLIANDPATTTSNTGGLVLPIFAQGDAPTPAKVSISPVESAAAVLTARVARRSEPIRGKKYLSDYLNTRKVYQLESGSMGTDTSATTDADASPGSGNTIAQTTYSTTATTAKRVTSQVTTKLDSIRGTWDVYVRVKATAASIHKLQLKWSPSTAGAQFSNPEQTIDLTTNGTATSFGYWMVNLGRFYVPEDPAVTLAGVTFEMWSRRTSGSGNLNWDYLTLVPIDEKAGEVSGGGNAAYFQQGSDLTSPPLAITGDPAWTGGSDSGSAIKLDASSDAAGLGPNTGLALGAGAHSVEFDVEPGSEGLAAPTTSECRVVNVTDDSEVASFALTAEGRRTIHISWTGASGKSYQPQVTITTLGSGQTKVWGISVESAIHTGQNEQIATDPITPSAFRRNSSSQVLTTMEVTGDTPVILNPGLNLLWVNLDDVPIAYHNQGENKRDRTATVKVTYSPRYHG